MWITSDFNYPPPPGVIPGIDKLKCDHEAASAKTVTEIKQILGLANYF